MPNTAFPLPGNEWLELSSALIPIQIQIAEKGNDGDTEAYSSPVDGAREKWSSALLKTTLWSHAVHDYSG